MPVHCRAIVTTRAQYHSNVIRLVANVNVNQISLDDNVIHVEQVSQLKITTSHKRNTYNGEIVLYSQ